MTYINYRIVIKVIGLLIFIMGIFLMIPSLTAAFYEDIVLLPFVKSSALCLTAGVILYMIKVPVKDIRKREGYLIVALGWIILCLLGSMPYLFEEGLDVSLTDAIFESTSGLTTTGATIFDDIESINPAILLWRSMTQWIGGMGIIVFTIAIFPILGIVRPCQYHK
jgi:trk system potassium uptake protein TrkH